MLDIGQLVTIPFPFSDIQKLKPRPVLVISQSDHYGDFICLAVTSKIHEIDAVPIVQADMKEGVLPLASWVRTDKIFTLNESLVIKIVGQLHQSTFEKIRTELCIKFGCQTA